MTTPCHHVAVLQCCGAAGSYVSAEEEAAKRFVADGPPHRLAPLCRFRPCPLLLLLLPFPRSRWQRSSSSRWDSWQCSRRDPSVSCVTSLPLLLSRAGRRFLGFVLLWLSPRLRLGKGEEMGGARNGRTAKPANINTNRRKAGKRNKVWTETPKCTSQRKRRGERAGAPSESQRAYLTWASALPAHFHSPPA